MSLYVFPKLQYSLFQLFSFVALIFKLILFCVLPFISLSLSFSISFLSLHAFSIFYPYSFPYRSFSFSFVMYSNSRSMFKTPAQCQFILLFYIYRYVIDSFFRLRSTFPSIFTSSLQLSVSPSINSSNLHASFILTFQCMW